MLRKPLLLEPEKAELIVMAVTHLHDFLRNSSVSENLYIPLGTFDNERDGQLIKGQWRTDKIVISVSINNLVSKF